MKFIKSISTSIFTLLLCTACESDLEQVTYSSENAIPSTLSSLNDSYILESKNASQEAFTLTWSYPDLGYQASVINALEMDVKDKNFANKVILASSKTDLSHTITVSDLNSKIMTLLKVYEIETAPTGIEFRLLSQQLPIHCIPTLSQPPSLHMKVSRNIRQSHSVEVIMVGISPKAKKYIR